MRVKDFTVVAALGVALTAGSACATKAADPAATPTASKPAAAPPQPAAAPESPSSGKPLRDPDVIYVPTPQNVVEAMLKMANVTANDVVYDLGSGDGRIPITAAQKYGARAIGIDINPERIKEANANLAKANVGDKVRFLNEDLFEIGSQTGNGDHALPAALAESEADPEAEAAQARHANRVAQLRHGHGVAAGED